MLLRVAQSNVFYDFMRIRLLCYAYFVVLSGNLPHLTLYYSQHKCLHTYDDRDFGINWTDYFQFSLLLMTWVISVPMVIYWIASSCKESIKYCLFPFLIANLVFLITTALLSAIVIIFSLIGANNYLTLISLACQLFVIFLGTLLTCIY